MHASSSRIPTAGRCSQWRVACSAQGTRLLLALVLTAISLDVAGQPRPSATPLCPPPRDLTDFVPVREDLPEAFANPPSAGKASSKQHSRANWQAGFRSPTVGLPINPISEIWKQYEIFKKRDDRNAGQYFPGTWKPLGPTEFIPGTKLTNNMGGLGRINSLAFDPQQPGRIFAGAAAGGLWLTENYGSSWQLATEDPRLLAISGLAIDPVDPQTIYALTGDGNASIAVVPARPSIGVLKSVDGGATWNMTGLDWMDTNRRYGFQLAIDPDNRCVLFATTNKGIYKTPDAGRHWKRVQQGDFRDFAFKPKDPSIAYASTITGVYRSTDSGETWNEVAIDVSWATGDAPGYRRVALGVSPDDPQVVYALFGGTTGLVGVYRSDDSGVTFTARAQAPNMLGYSSYGGDSNSVAFYALTLGISPIDVDEVYLGAVNIWKSTDGGSNWTMATSYKNEPLFFPYVHADTHALAFQPIPPGLDDAPTTGTEGQRYALFSANDGGLAVTFDDGKTWKHRSRGLRITQAFRVCGTPQDPELVYFGAQDNGSSLLHLSTETAHATFRGDGMQCQVDYTDSQTVYFSQSYGTLFRSLNGGKTGVSITPPIGTGKGTGGAYLTPFILHPTDPHKLYACYTDLWMSPDQGNTWSNLTEGALGTETCVDIQISPAAPDHIWVAKGATVYRSKQDKSWANMTRNLPVGSTSITRIALSPSDPEKAWVTLGGYSEHLKIYGTHDGGQMWENMSRNLLNLPANDVVAHSLTHDGTTEHHLFLATDIGVFFHSETLCKDNEALCEWLPFFQGMNPLIVLDLDLHPEAGKLRAATFAQGIWESDLPPLTER